MNQHPINLDLALTLAENRRRELQAAATRERVLEAAGRAAEHHRPRRAIGHGLIRIGYALMAPRDRILPRTVNPVHF